MSGLNRARRLAVFTRDGLGRRLLRTYSVNLLATLERLLGLLSAFGGPWYG